MRNLYTLKNAITFNPAGEKYNAVASIATLKEIKQHSQYFRFDFGKLYRQGYTLFKITREGETDILQGLVAFSPSIGVLNCANMELSNLNKKGMSLYSGVGKCMVALCCKISFDLGFDGYITFEAKNRLMPYYIRFGAIKMGGLRMAIETKEAKKLVDLYF